MTGIRRGPRPGLGSAQVEELRARVGAGRPQSVTAAAEEMGISRATAHRYLAAPAEPWRPACMDPDEYALWRDGRGLASDRHGVGRPCSDCTLGFAAEMRAVGRCNGTPAGAEPLDEEEDRMELDTVTRRLEVAGDLPCATCSHEVVCGLRAGLDAARQLQVILPKLPTVQSVDLVATFRCEYHERARGKAKSATAAGSTAGRKLNLSPEERERRRRQALELVNRQREQAEQRAKAI